MTAGIRATTAALGFIVISAMCGPALAETCHPCSDYVGVTLDVVDSLDPVVVGSPLTYTATLTNNSSYSYAFGGIISIHVPREVSFVSASVSRGTWSYLDGVVSVNFGDISFGDSAWATVDVVALSAGKTICWADFGSLYWDPDYTMWGDEMWLYADGIVARNTTTITDAPDLLSISKLAWPEPVVAGSTMGYRLLVSNNSSETATGVVVSDDLPAGVTYVSGRADRGTFTRSGDLITWNVGSLGSTEQAVLEIKVVPPVPATLTNTASVIANEPDPDQSNNQAEVVTHVVSMDWPVMEKIGDGLSGTVGWWRNVSMSFDGRFIGVGIPTTAPCLQTPRVFDRVTGTTRDADVNDYGEPAIQPAYYLDWAWTLPWPGTFAPVLSDDGRFVSFASPAINLVPGDTNCLWDAFIHDSMTGHTERSSETPEGWQMAFYFLGWPPPYTCGMPYLALYTTYSVISGDGEQALFGFPGHLVWQQGYIQSELAGLTQIHTRNRSTGQMKLALTLGDSDFGIVSSADGDAIAYVRGYWSWERNQAYVRTVSTSADTLVSVGPGGVEGNGRSKWPSISGDGRYVAFESLATNLVLHDTNGMSDIFVRDCVKGVTERVSVSSVGAQANGPSYWAWISQDGRYVTFQSEATNLAPMDNNSLPDIFVHDRQTGKTVLVSRSGFTPGDGASTVPVISGDGRFVAFQSLADNLLPGDTDHTKNIYVCDWQRLPEVTDMHVNCGGPAISGWSADMGFKNGRTLYTPKLMANTGEAPQLIYQTQRYGKFDYNFPNIPNGSYLVRLHFVETYYTKPGCRLFDVYVEGSQVLQKFDIFAAARGRYIGITREFPVTVRDGNGLQIVFKPVKVDATLCGIEIFRVQ